MKSGLKIAVLATLFAGANIFGGVPPMTDEAIHCQMRDMELQNGEPGFFWKILNMVLPSTPDPCSDIPIFTEADSEMMVPQNGSHFYLALAMMTSVVLWMAVVLVKKMQHHNHVLRCKLPLEGKTRQEMKQKKELENAYTPSMETDEVPQEMTIDPSTAASTCKIDEELVAQPSKKGKKKTGEFLIRLKASGAALMSDDLVQELQSKHGVRIPNSKDIVYVDGSKEYADLIYQEVSSEIQKRASSKQALIGMMDSNLLKHDGDVGPLFKVNITGESVLGQKALFIFRKNKDAENLGQMAVMMRKKFFVKMEIHGSLVILQNNYEDAIAKAYKWILEGCQPLPI